MLNAVWVSLLCSGVLAGLLRRNVSYVIGEILASTGSAVQTLIAISGAICFWAGLMRVARASGLSQTMAGLVKPLMRGLFPDLRPDSAAYEYVALNISANLLGIGGAATPLGLKAMEEMAALQPKKHASNSMCTLVVLNTVGPSIIPATVVALRSSLGSKLPDIIVGPAFIGGVLAASVALLSDRVFQRAR